MDLNPIKKILLTMSGLAFATMGFYLTPDGVPYFVTVLLDSDAAHVRYALQAMEKGKTIQQGDTGFVELSKWKFAEMSKQNNGRQIPEDVKILKFTNNTPMLVGGQLINVPTCTVTSVYTSLSVDGQNNPIYMAEVVIHRNEIEGFFLKNIQKRIRILSCVVFLTGLAILTLVISVDLMKTGQRIEVRRSAAYVGKINDFMLQFVVLYLKGEVFLLQIFLPKKRRQEFKLRWDQVLDRMSGKTQIPFP